MKWYTGSIVEAVAHAQAKKSLFCVAIFGDDTDSATLEASLESSEVQRILEAEGVVAVRIGSASEEFQQFGAIYQNVRSPSIYCITTGGVAVQVIVGAVDSAELKSRLDVAVNLHREAIVTSTSGPSPSSSVPQTTPSAGSTPIAAAAAASSSANGSDSQSQSSLEERIERAKQIAAAKQRQKRDEEAEETRKRENERREAGKKVAELKRWQDEQETKRLAEERRKDKQEEAALRQRLREQIAQDRIDREARANQGTPGSATAPPPTKAESSSTPTPSAPTNYTGLARLQFRLPDGTSHTHAFEPETTLGSIIAYLSTNIAVPPQGFSIWVAFPRRELGSSENGSTLRDLGLLPSAALLIIPNPDARILPRVGAGAGGVISMLSAVVQVLLSPLMYVWNWIRPTAEPTGQPQNRAGPSRGTMGRAGNAPGRAEGGGRGQNDEVLRNRGGRPGSGEAEPRDKSSGESFGRTEGNIRRFHNSNSDSDDEQGTYNGNSTQQM